ncbi:hypothetical protein DTO271G3_2230 [Paecilomyces variotii]|nr:hypothetical protein DTO271G3_2230 [Paecilomyces variotii]
MPPNVPANTPNRRGPPLGSSPQAPILVPSEASSGPDDVDELLRRLRALLNEFRLLVVKESLAKRIVPAASDSEMDTNMDDVEGEEQESKSKRKRKERAASTSSSGKKIKLTSGHQEEED